MAVAASGEAEVAVAAADGKVGGNGLMGESPPQADAPLSGDQRDEERESLLQDVVALFGEGKADVAAVRESGRAITDLHAAVEQRHREMLQSIKGAHFPVPSHPLPGDQLMTPPARLRRAHRPAAGRRGRGLAGAHWARWRTGAAAARGG